MKDEGIIFGERRTANGERRTANGERRSGAADKIMRPFILHPSSFILHLDGGLLFTSGGFFTAGLWMCCFIDGLVVFGTGSILTAFPDFAER
jgi:hypothetical protein